MSSAQSAPAAITPRGVRDGDPEVLAALCARRGPAVLAFVAEVCPPPVVTRAVADAFARFRAAVASDDGAPAVHPDALLLRFARHAALDVVALGPDLGCVSVPSLLVRRAEQDLSKDEAGRLEHHLGTCEHCGELAAALGRAEEAYRTADDTEIGTELTAAVVAALAAAAPVRATPKPTPAPEPREAAAEPEEEVDDEPEEEPQYEPQEELEEQPEEKAVEQPSGTRRVPYYEVPAPQGRRAGSRAAAERAGALAGAAASLTRRAGRSARRAIERRDAPAPAPEPAVLETPAPQPEPVVAEKPTPPPEPVVAETPAAPPEPVVAEKPASAPEPAATEAPAAPPEPEAADTTTWEPVEDFAFAPEVGTRRDEEAGTTDDVPLSPDPELERSTAEALARVHRRARHRLQDAQQRRRSRIPPPRLPRPRRNRDHVPLRSHRPVDVALPALLLVVATVVIMAIAGVFGGGTSQAPTGTLAHGSAPASASPADSATAVSLAAAVRVAKHGPASP